MKKEIGKKWRGSLAVLFLAVLMLTACGEKTLSAKTFTDVVKTYGFSVKDSKTKAEGQKDWVNGKNHNGGVIDYVEFNSAGSAVNFYDTQAKQINEQTGATASGSIVSTNFNGYYYYLTRKDKVVILATVKSEDTSIVKNIISELPDPE